VSINGCWVWPCSLRTVSTSRERFLLSESRSSVSTVGYSSSCCIMKENLLYSSWITLRFASGSLSSATSNFSTSSSSFSELDLIYEILLVFESYFAFSFSQNFEQASEILSSIAFIAFERQGASWFGKNKSSISSFFLLKHSLHSWPGFLQ